jgi:ribonuclease P protein component
MPSPRANSFRKHEHLRARKDFERLFERRCSVADQWLVVYAQPNGLAHSRIGFGVARKIGSAVRRNRFRRLYREAYRLIKTDLPAGLDLLLVPRSSREPTLQDVQESLRALVPLVEKKLQRQEKKA